MITNLLNTLMLSASISLGATRNFNNELKPNKAQEQNQVAYTEETTNTNWQIRKNLINVKDETYKTYNVHEKSEQSNTISTPNNYLQIRQISEIVQDTNNINGEEDPGNGKIACTTRDNEKITTYLYNRTESNYLLRTPALQYTKIEITPTNANSNLTFEWYSNIVIYPQQTEVQDLQANFGYKALLYITTTQLNNDNSYTCIRTIQDEQRYTGKVKYNLLDQGQYVGGTKRVPRITITDINIVSNVKNYIYIWIQPVYIFNQQNEYTQRYGIITTNETIYMAEYPQQQTEWEEDLNERNTYTTISGVNTPMGSYEVVDIGGIAFTILGMPFTFISTAFNLTLFPGTPYQVNISTLFLSVFAVIVFVFIVKMILGAIGNK